MFVLDDMLAAALAATVAAEATAATGATIAATTAAAAAPEVAAAATTAATAAEAGAALSSAAPAATGMDIGAALGGTPLASGPVYSPGTEAMLTSREALLGGTSQQLAANTAANMPAGQPMFNPANAEWAQGLAGPTGNINPTIGGNTSSVTAPREYLSTMTINEPAAPTTELVRPEMEASWLDDPVRAMDPMAQTEGGGNWFQRNLGFDPTPSRGDVARGLGGSTANALMNRRGPQNVNSTVSAGGGSGFSGRSGGGSAAASMPGQLLPGQTSPQRLPWLQGLAGYNSPMAPQPAPLLRR
jgi:hypothetical protein